jgi:hypothetical protein
VVKDVGVRPPNDGQAAADDARPRPPEAATPAAVHVVRVAGGSQLEAVAEAYAAIGVLCVFGGRIGLQIRPN